MSGLSISALTCIGENEQEFTLQLNSCNTWGGQSRGDQSAGSSSAGSQSGSHQFRG